MNSIVKICLAVLLLMCLLKLPYGYYTFVRWACCVGFVWLAYEAYEEQTKALLIPLIAVAILFNPIAPIYLDKQTWHPIDVLIAVLLIIWIAFDFISNPKFKQ